MTKQEQKAAEARVRRRAAKYGYKLSRGQSGGYALSYKHEGLILEVIGHDAIAATLDQIDAYLDLNRGAQDAAEIQLILGQWYAQQAACGGDAQVATQTPLPSAT
jgi:hypothetical protein